MTRPNRATMNAILRATRPRGIRRTRPRGNNLAALLRARPRNRFSGVTARLRTGAFARYGTRARQGLRRMRARARQRLSGTHYYSHINGRNVRV